MIGIAFRGYGRFPFYDKVVHTLSGVVFGLLGVIFYYLMKKDRTIVPRDGIFAGYFAVSFACTIGMLWEVWEYSMDFIFHSDPQHALTTGVHDTMQDMIVCLIGSLFVLFSVWRYYHKGKAGPDDAYFPGFLRIELKMKRNIGPLQRPNAFLFEKAARRLFFGRLFAISVLYSILSDTYWQTPKTASPAVSES